MERKNTSSHVRAVITSALSAILGYVVLWVVLEAGKKVFGKKRIRLDAPTPFLVTLNHSGAIDPARVIKRIAYHHPVYTPASVAAQARQRELNGRFCTYYCGAWWRNGFHEDGVVSALQALSHFEQNHAQRAVYRSA